MYKHTYKFSFSIIVNVQTRNIWFILFIQNEIFLILFWYRQMVDHLDEIILLYNDVLTTLLYPIFVNNCLIWNLKFYLNLFYLNTISNVLPVLSVGVFSAFVCTLPIIVKEKHELFLWYNKNILFHVCR